MKKGNKRYSISISYDDFVKHLDISKASITRILRELKKKNFIDTIKHGFAPFEFYFIKESFPISIN